MIWPAPLGVKTMPRDSTTLLVAICQDSLPEWSKGVDSSSTSASCVGSNPTAVNGHAPEWVTDFCLAAAGARHAQIRRVSVSVHAIAGSATPQNTCSCAAGSQPTRMCGAFCTAHGLCGAAAASHHTSHVCCTDVMTLAGLEPAVVGSEDQRLIH